MTIVERLVLFMKEEGLTQSSLSKKIGVSQSTIATLIKRNKGFNADILESLSIVFSDLNINWLLTGDGEMIKTVNDGVIDGVKAFYIQAHMINEYISILDTPSNNRLKVATLIIPHLVQRNYYYFAFDVIDDRLSRGIEPALRVNDIVIAEMMNSRDSSLFKELVTRPNIVVVLSDKYGQLIRKVTDYNDKEIVLSPTHPFYIEDTKEFIKIKIKDIKRLGIVKKIIVSDPVFSVDDDMITDSNFLANSTPL